MSALDLRALLGALQAADVDAIVIGGVAVAAHGYVRATADLVWCPPASRRTCAGSPRRCRRWSTQDRADLEPLPQADGG